MSILEDLSTLSPRKLEKRLAQLAKDALPCIDVWAAEANREDGLTVALQVDARSRPEVGDLGRVLEEEPRALVTTAWAIQAERTGRSRLLLRVAIERPVACSFDVLLCVTDDPHDPIRSVLPLLLAAARLLVITLDGQSADRPSFWFSAPKSRGCLRELLGSP